VSSNPNDEITPHPVVWFEVWLHHGEDRLFYEQLLGWRSESFSDYDQAYRVISGADQEGTAGALVLPDSKVPTRPGTVVYAQVSDLAAAVARASDLEGTVEIPPTLITETAGAFAIVRDPHGNRIGLWSRGLSRL
jgi:predicted enzyme related to lactoylglutathione lyase